MGEKKKSASVIAAVLSAVMVCGGIFPYVGSAEEIFAVSGNVIAEKTEKGYHLKNDYFDVETGEYGEITSLKIVGDEFDTNYVMNVKDNPNQDTAAHEWLGDLMFKTKKAGEENWTESLTNSSDAGRSVELDGNKVVVTYDNSKTEGERAIKDFKLVETYSLVEDQLRWEITVENTTDSELIFGDFGVPLAFHEIWVNQGEAYETCTVDHSFVGKDSSYVYATRPSGQGGFLLMTPDTETGAGFEYQDHWQVGQRRAEEKEWCMDQADWANGLNVFYIHSDAISKDEKSGNKGYMESSSMTLGAGESKTYAFHFTGVQDESHMKSVLYDEGIIDAVAVPGMTFAKDMPAKMYLHTAVPAEDISFEFRCPHTNNLHKGTNTVSSNLPCEKTEENTYAKYVETKTIDGEQYHIYDIGFGDLGQNDIVVNYKQNGQNKTTMLQFYMMADLEEALDTHSDFLVKNTQWDAPGEIQDKVFDDWMMDTKSKRGSFDGYWGWGDDWGYVHGEYLAEMNSYNPVAEQVQALDEYLDVAIWQNLMQEHQEDFLIHDFLMAEPNTTPTYRGFAYPHIYNTYFSMYKIAEQYPDLIAYIEEPDTYLLRCYHIMDALYNEGTVGYNWETGLMGESTTPDIIEALRKRGYEAEADNLVSIMEKKLANFSSEKYPYVSEYPYDNTSEEAIYTLAKMFGNDDIMSMVDKKTRACRGVQPIWYHYGNPTTICGENWFNFQYTASLAGYCMDDWLRFQNNGLDSEELGEAQRINYAGKLANFTVINSGQIDADPANIGTVAWTYQSEMGNDTALGTGGGKLHNGWRQMSGEADLALFGAVRIASSDVATDPVFGLFGYGCEVEDRGDTYAVTPLDGVYHRLNLINEKISLELYRDQYQNAVVSKDGTDISMDIVNVTGQEHESNLDITGIPAGNYQVLVDGEVAGSFIAGEGTTTVALPLSEGDSAKVEIRAGELLTDTTPVVDAGEDRTVSMEDEVVLHGSARDAAWLHTEPEVTWTAEETPTGSEVQFANAASTSTKVTFSTPGEYVLKLTAKGKHKSASDTVTITVEGMTELPEVLAQYDFEEGNLDASKKTVKDISGSGIDAEQKGKVETAEGRDGGQGISMDGEVGGYVKLSDGLTRYIKETTIAMDVNLNGVQTSGTRLFEFGDMEENLFYVAFESANELSLNVTNLETGETATAKSGVLLNAGNWQNVEVTLKENTAVLYINGEKYAELTDTGFSFDKLGTVQRNFIGRSCSESTPWLNGTYDNFKMMSKALSEEEIDAEYGSDAEVQVTDVVISPVITSVGVEPSMPKTAKVEYSNGLCRYETVTWDVIDKSAYAAKGQFEATGRIETLNLDVKTMVQVVEGKEQNIALTAQPTAIIDTPSDLGGVAGLNDGYDPADSRDKTHGVWHNWQGDQTAEAWVQYTWNTEVTITSTEAYYFTDGNFAPASVNFQYLDSDGNWKDVQNGDGFGVKMNQYNKTTFAPVTTTAFRMLMTPKTLGCGVIEWKVMGYSDEMAADKQLLKAALEKANALDSSLFAEGAAETLAAAIAEAQVVYDNKDAKQDEVDAAAAKLERVMAALPTADGNLAFSATPSTSFVSGWEKLSAVNDGKMPENSKNPGMDRYGTWGNKSNKETITYTWSTEVTLKSADIYFWYDGEQTDNGGINLPSSYMYEYLDGEGNWVEVANPSAYEREINQCNHTDFDEITTTAVRVTLNKQTEDETGVGVMEWKVYGDSAQADKSALTEAITEAENLNQEDYTQETWDAFSKALANAKAIEADAQASKKEVEIALSALVKAKNNLVKADESEEGTRNLAPGAATAGLCNYDGQDGRPDDLGGLKALNDKAEPANSADTSNGAWHNWHNRYDEKKNIADGWISYTWEEPVVLESSKAYYFQNGNGDFLPQSVKYEYLDSEGSWAEIPNAQGLECKADQYNETTFDKITTTAIRMTMVPQIREENTEDPSRGTGVLEWQVMGIYESELPDKSALQAEVTEAEKKVQTDYTEESWAVFSTALEAAKQVMNEPYADKAQVEKALSDLQLAMENLKKPDIKPEGNNIAVEAATDGLCNYDGQDGRPDDLGGLAALNDNQEPVNSADTSNYVWHNWQDRYDGAGNAVDGWVSYTWEKPVKVDNMAVYYFQNEVGNFLPESASVEYMDENGEWIPVDDAQNMVCEADKYNIVELGGIQTTALRLTMKPQQNPDLPEDSSRGVGVLEWKVIGAYVEEQPEPADKEGLKVVLNTAKEKQEKDYIPSTWKMFKAAFDEANRVCADPEVTQEAVDNAKSALETAMANLVMRADGTNLKALIDRAEKKKEADYTAESWGVFAQALVHAKAALENPELIQSQADELENALRDAMSNLVEKLPVTENVKKDALKQAVEEAGKKKEADYTAESWKAFARVLGEARTILADENSTQKQVDNITALLNAAMRNLLPEEEKPDEQADKTQLKKLVEEAGKLSRADYTEETWMVFQNALVEAQKVLADEVASQETVDKAKAELEAAKGQLVKVQNSQEEELKKKSTGTAKPATSSGSNNTGKGSPSGGHGAKTGDTLPVWPVAGVTLASLVILALAGRGKNKGLKNKR